MKRSTIFSIFILAALAGNAQERDADVLLKQAITATNTNANYTDGIRLAESALAISPEYADVRLLLGRLYLLTGQLDKSRIQLEWVTSRQPANADALTYLVNLESQAKNYPKAIAYTERLTAIAPNDDLLLRKAGLLAESGDFKAAAIFLRPYAGQNVKFAGAWKDYQLSYAKKYFDAADWENARREYLEVLRDDPQNETALVQLYSVEAETRNYEKALYYSEEGLKYYPGQENFLFKKAAVLGTLERPVEAYAVAKELTVKYPESTPGKRLADDLYEPSRQNKIGVSYDLVFFDQRNTDPWHYTRAHYTRYGEHTSLTAAVNYANRGAGGNGVQFEIEAYPRHNKSYSFINLAYSNAVIFPRFRFGYAYFQDLNNGWEGELAVRYINVAKEHFAGIGGSIGKYFGSYWLNVRPLAILHQDNVYPSLTVTGRRYLNNRNNYLTLILATGNSPDDRNRDFLITQRYNLSSYSITGGFQQLIGRSTLLGILGTVNNQEFVRDRRRNEFDVFLQLQRKF